MATPANSNVQQAHTVPMTTGEYYFHKASQFLVGGSVRLVALQQAVHAGARISECALRYVEFGKALVFGTRPVMFSDNGHVPAVLVELANRTIVQLNSRTFGMESTARLFKDSIPFVVTSILAWELGSFFFGRPSPLYNIVSVLPINLRSQSLQEMISTHGGIRNAISAWVDRTMGRGQYANGASSAKELKQEMIRKVGQDKAQDFCNAIDAAECESKKTKAPSSVPASPALAALNQNQGQVVASTAVNFFFGGSMRLVALQQALGAALRISEVALRSVDMGKSVIFGTRAMVLGPHNSIPAFATEGINAMLRQYSIRGFTSFSSLQLLKEAAPFAASAIVLWELANYFFGAPSSAYNVVSVLPITVRKDTLSDMIDRHGGIFPATRAFIDCSLGRGDFVNGTRSRAEITQDLQRKYGDGSSEVIQALETAYSK